MTCSGTANWKRCLLAVAVVLAAHGNAWAQIPYDLDTLRVSVGSRASATLPVLTRNVQVIHRHQIALMPARNVQEVLARALGVDLLSRSPAQANVAVHGSSFEQVLVMVNQVKVNDLQTGHFHLNLAVPLEDIQRIEILRGPASSLYGADAVGGVINIVTDNQPSRHVHAGVNAGSFRTAGLALGAGAAGERFDGRISGDASRSDGHRRPGTHPDSSTGTDYFIAQARTSGTAAIGRSTLRAEIGIAARDFGARRFYTSPTAHFDEYEETRTLTGSLALEPERDNRFTIQPRLNFRRHSDDFVLFRNDPEFYRNTHTSWRVGGDVTGRLALTTGANLAFGAEASSDRLKSTNLGDRREWRGALFAEAAAGHAGQAMFNVGIRADGHSEYGGYLAPSVSGAFWPTSALRLHASAGRAFRAPNWTERYYSDPENLGNPELQPERAWAMETGASLSLGPGLRLTASAFQRRATQLIDWARPRNDHDAMWTALNVSSARFVGVELEVKTRIGDNTTANTRFSALSVDAATSGSYVSKYALRPLTRTMALELERTLPLGLTAAGHVRSARRAGDREAYTLVDGRIMWRGTSTTSLFLDVLNLTDSHYLDVARLPAAGRSFHAGLNWNR